MKKLIVLIFISVLLASCGNHENDAAAIKKQIRDYREDIVSLNDKIEKLKTKLDALGDSSDMANAIKVRVENAAVKPFSEYFEAIGEVEARDEAFISPEVAGQIISIFVKEGQKVKKGQLLAKLDTKVIEKNMDDVKTQLEYAETLYNKQKQLWDKNIGSERQYLDSKNKYQTLKNKLATLQAQYNRSLIHSPINGYVEELLQQKGELATPGIRMMHIVDLDKLKVTAMISEAHLPSIRPGEMVDITFPTFPGIKFHKPITLIGKVVNKQNRTFKIQVELENSDGKLKPNLLANIRINNYNSDTNIVIPSLVIREDMKGSYLYVAEKEGNHRVAKKKYLKVGRSYRNKSEILSGLNVGDKVITDGYSNVSDGTIISIAG